MESVPVSVADAQVGDAGVSGRVRVGVLAPRNWGYPPFLCNRELETVSYRAGKTIRVM